MHMRMSNDDVVEKLLRILTAQAHQDAEMRLAASIILHALALDHANLGYFNGAAVAFLAQLARAGAQDAAVMALGSAAAAVTSPKRAGVFSRGHVLPKIRMGNRMADGKSRKKETAAESILPRLSDLVDGDNSQGEQPSAAAFALRTLEVLSDQHQLKDEFRASGLLDHLAGMICRDARRLHVAAGGLRNADVAVVVRSMMPCMHILEKVTFLNEANAAYLVNTASCAEVVKALLGVLAVCDGADIGIKVGVEDGAKEHDVGSDTDDEQLTSRVIMSVCLRVLVNLTNDQPVGCALVASDDSVAVTIAAAKGASSSGDSPSDTVTRIKQEREEKPQVSEGKRSGKLKHATKKAAAVASNSVGKNGNGAMGKGGLACVMRAVVTALTYQWHDSLIVALALVVNLLEQNDECCEQLENLELHPPPKVETKAKTQAPRRGAGTTYLKLSIGSTDNLLPSPTRALSFFCDLYISTSGAAASDAKTTGTAGMPESQLHDEGSDEEEDGSSSLGIVSGYAAVLLGFLCLRRQVTGCASRVSARLAAADAGESPHCLKAAEAGAGTAVGFKALIESVRNFGVVHAEAGVLHEAQARLFDEVIACLTKELDDGDG